MTTRASHVSERERSDPIESAPGPVLPVGTARGGVHEVILLAYPVILTQLSMTLMGVVDSAMVGRLGASELAAVGLGGVWVWTLICFFIGTATGVQTFVAQFHGAQRPRECGAWTWQGLYFLVPLTLLTAIVVYLCVEPLVRSLGPSTDVQPLAVDYMRARTLGLTGMCSATVLSAFFRGVGDTRTPMYATIAANLLNAGLDYGLIYGAFGLPRLGVRGAGLATAISEWSLALVLLLIFLRPALRVAYGTRWIEPARRSIGRLIRTGAPIGGQWLLEMLSFAFFLTLVARMGDAPMAASQAFISLLSLSFMQATGLGIGVSTLVGRYIGAEDLDSADRSFRSGLKLASVIGGLVGLLFIAVPGVLMRIFTNEASVLALGGPLLAMGAVFQFFDALAIVTDGALRGAGDTRVPFLVRFSLAWGLFLPAAWLIGDYLGYGLTGAWLGGSLYVIVLSLYLVWRFRSGAWREIRI